MRPLLLLLFPWIVCSGSCSQDTTKSKAPGQPTQKGKVGGGCEGCKGIYESPVPFEKLSELCWLPDWNGEGTKLGVNGVVYKPDGTPAAGVIMYVYHTDQTGHYSTKGNETGWGKRHGYIRGWMKTNEKGEYKFMTLKPIAYPGRNIPAHIHVAIKEPGTNEYWIDDYVFDDDPLLTTAERKKQESRGGNGIVVMEEKEGMLYGERDIYLGRNIPGYPQTKITGLRSGLNLGDNCPAFDLLHLSGADKAKHSCPMCKYGYGQGVMVWFNHTSLDRLKRFDTSLETEIETRGLKNFRVFLVYMNPTYDRNDISGQKILQGKIEKWCAEQNLITRMNH